CLEQRAVVAGADGCIEINQLHEREVGEAFNPFVEIVELELFFASLFELDDFSAHQINRRNQHGYLTGICSDFNCRLRSEKELRPKWKMEAASAASAWPARNTSTKSFAPPAPPEAITGICTACETAHVSSQSKPMPVPSRSMEVSRISPAPQASASLAHPTASLPVGLRPPWTKASKPPFARLASIATITACDPKRFPIFVMMEGSAIAAELMLILSAPASKIAAASSNVRTPPPTEKGTNISRAVRRTVSSNVVRFSCVAVISSR